MIKFSCNEIDRKSHREIIDLIIMKKKKEKKGYVMKKIGRLCLVFSTIIT